MIDWDNLSPEQFAIESEKLRAKTPPSYLGVVILWILDLFFIGLGIVMVRVVMTSTVSGGWLPLAIVFAICGGAVLLVPQLVKWTRSVGPEKAAWHEKYGRGQ